MTKLTKEQEARRAFVQAALDAQADVERTGVVYPSDEVHAYFLARAAGKSAPKPKPIIRKPR